MLLELILPSLIPAGIDAVKSVFGGVSRKFFGLSVDDQLKLETAGIERLKALAQLDAPVGTPSLWVVNLRASFRYIAALVSILAGIALMFYSPLETELATQLIGMPFSFIFGERMYLAIKGQPK